MKNKEIYNWDLDDLLNGKSLEFLYDEWKRSSVNIINYYPNFLKSKKHFKKWINLNNMHEILSNRIFNYVSNNLNEDIVNSTWNGWMQKLQVESNKLSVALSNYENIIIKNERQIKKFLKDKDLIIYQRYFDSIFRFKNHILSDKEELVLSKLSILNSSIEDIFETLSDTEIKFGQATNKNGKKIDIKTIGDVQINLKSKDRNIRKTTWINFNKAFFNFKNTLTKTLYYNYLQLNTHSKIRKFNNYVSSTAFNDEVDVEYILNIYKNIEKFKPLIKKYKERTNYLLKKQLNITKLEPWDKSVDLHKKEIKFSIEQAKSIAIKALSPLGEEYINNIKKAFNERWISWLPKENKQSGAYSIGGTKGLNKMYISMNYSNTIGSVSTLVHELGHSMHSLYFNKFQGVYTSCSIFYAEIASIVNEVLLSYYWIDNYKNDKTMLTMVYDTMINDFFSTTTRQIIFSNFEYEAIKMIENNQEFSFDSIEKLYLKMIDKYEGLKKSQLMKYKKEPFRYNLSTILRISHFYIGNFYVYKYSIGQIVAIIVANKIYHGDKDMLDKYFKFLKSGNSKSPIETIKLLDIDLKNPQIWSDAYKIINNWINKFKKLN